MNHPIWTHAVSDPTTPLLERVLDFRLERHALIASNIANAETPRYQAVDLAFEEALQKAMASHDSPVPVRTHRRHLPLGAQDGVIITPTRVHRQSFSVGNDLNTVDLDTEMTQLTRNNLLYNTTAQLLSRKFSTMRLAIEGGR